nr:hypothetical protein [Ningiella sp. W23]
MKTFTLSALALAIMLTGCQSAPSLNNKTNNTETSPLNTEQQANPWWESAIFTKFGHAVFTTAMLMAMAILMV